MSDATWTPFGRLEPCPACGGEAELPWPALPEGAPSDASTAGRGGTR